MSERETRSRRRATSSAPDVEPIWLGRIMSNPDWSGQGVYQNETRKRHSFHGVSIGRGEVGLYVMWYEKIDVMSERLEYWVSRSEKNANCPE